MAKKINKLVHLSVERGWNRFAIETEDGLSGVCYSKKTDPGYQVGDEVNLEKVKNEEDGTPHFRVNLPNKPSGSYERKPRTGKDDRIGNQWAINAAIQLLQGRNAAFSYKEIEEEARNLIKTRDKLSKDVEERPF